jgi:hypothetical protein
LATCPPATRDIKLNLKNRQVAIDTAHYGPLNPLEPNEEYWQAKADQFNTSVEEAKTALCANCGFFNQTKEILDCIAGALGQGENIKDAWDTIDAGDVGYCEAFDFKCAGKRTCDAWLAGGPITDETKLNIEPNPCWEGYEPIGLKDDGTPNCVPIKEK